MGKAYNRLFTGILFTVININIGPIDILPNFIGYIMMLSGLSMLFERTSIKAYQIASSIGCLLLIESLVGIFYPNNLLVDNISVILVTWMVISELIKLLFVYFIYTASIELLQKHDDIELKETIKTGRTTYVYTLMVITALHTFIPNLNVEIRTTVVIISIFVSFIMIISFMINLNKLKKYFDQLHYN